MKIKNIKFIDLFAGIGGFHKAIEIVAEKNNFNAECVFVSEIDQFAIETYIENFDVEREKIINIRDVDDKASEIPEHDFLFAGFPCQTFSNAGKKKGFLDQTRGTLFFDIVKVLKNKKPKYILLENVKHLIKHNNGETWEIITNTLSELGYIIPKEPLIVSPHEFGIPQDRPRVFIPGVLKDKTNYKGKYLNINLDPYKINNPLNSNDIKKIQDYLWNNFLEKDVDDKYFLKNLSEKEQHLIKVFDAWNDFLKNVKKPKDRTMPVIWTFEFGKNDDISNLPKWKQKYLLDMRSVYDENKEFIDLWMKKYEVCSWGKREQKLEWQAGKEIDEIKKTFIQLRQSGIRCRRPIKFPTLVAMVQTPLIFDRYKNDWRYLTPREVANLQSFPSNFKIHNEIKNQDKNFYSYKQFGNSVNVYVISLIQELLLKEY